MDKYLGRGLERMPWTEMSQAEFLQFVVSFPAGLPRLMADDVMLKVSIALMEQAVRDPERLYRSVYKILHNKGYRTSNNGDELKPTSIQETNKTTSTNGGKGQLSATEKISSIFNKKNAGLKCKTNSNSNNSISSNEVPPSPKAVLSRSSRLGSIKTITTPTLQRKCKLNDLKESIIENETEGCNENDEHSSPNSRPNSMIIQVPVA